MGGGGSSGGERAAAGPGAESREDQGGGGAWPSEAREITSVSYPRELHCCGENTRTVSLEE